MEAAGEFQVWSGATRYASSYMLGHACMHERRDGWMAGWVGGLVVGWMDGWMDGWMEWMDGWMDGFVHSYTGIHMQVNIGS